MTEEELLLLRTSTLSSEVAISSRELLIVYKNTWLQEVAPLKSIIRHRNLDLRGMFEPFEVYPLWDGKKKKKNNEIFKKWSASQRNIALQEHTFLSLSHVFTTHGGHA